MGFLSDHPTTRTVTISARKIGAIGAQSAAWYYPLEGTKSDKEAIDKALDLAQRKYGHEFENFMLHQKFDHLLWRDGNYIELYRVEKGEWP